MVNGISESGFQRKRLDEILSDKNTAVQGVLGSNLNLSPESPDGQINGVYSESDALLWELAEACYNAFAPSKATGATLSDLVELNGLKRKEATFSVVTLDLTGTVGATIPIGSFVSAVDNAVIFSTDVEVSVGAGGTVSVGATATQTGPIAALAGTVTVIDSPLTGWATATNPADAVIGQDLETDAELRFRRSISVQNPSESMLGGIVSGVLAVDSVTYAAGFENDTDSVDAAGIPAHGILIVAEGGTDEDVASAILLRKAAGITSSGNTAVNVEDSQGVSKEILFSRPVQMDIYVRVDINTFAGFPTSGEDDIKQAIVDYANGVLIANRGFGVDEDVIRTELFTPVNTVDFQSVAVLAIKEGSAPGAGDLSDIAIGIDERAAFDTANIVVNIL